MVDPEKQAALIAALRKKSEELAKTDPVFADMRLIGKVLLDEGRKRFAEANRHTSLGAVLREGKVSLVEPEAIDAPQAAAEIILKLREFAKPGNIQTAAMCSLIDKQIPGGSVEKFISVHTEHSTGRAIISQMPADERVLMKAVPGVTGAGVGMISGPAAPKIFATANSGAPILKIAVLADGRITVNGSTATIDSVRASLKQLAEQKGVVWYYREQGHAEAPPESQHVIKALIENRLPIRLSSRPDYSDAIGTDGKPVPSGPLN
jgi:hypothetical protein